MSFSKSNRHISSVVVEYDKGDKRVTKEFTDPIAARRFYTAKDKAGKRPKIVSATR